MGIALTIACSAAATAALATIAALEDTRTHLLRNNYTMPIIAIGLTGLPAATLLDNGALSDTFVDMAIGSGWFARSCFVTHLVAP